MKSGNGVDSNIIGLVSLLFDFHESTMPIYRIKTLTLRVRELDSTAYKVGIKPPEAVEDVWVTNPTHYSHF